MNTSAALELIRLDDSSSSVVVRLTGTPASVHGDLEAELEVTSSFANVRATLFVNGEDFDEWAECLDLLQEGEQAADGSAVSVHWSTSGRQPWLTVAADDGLEVEVGDPTQSGIRVRIPLRLGSANADWIEDSRERLRAVRKAWGV